MHVSQPILTSNWTTARKAAGELAPGEPPAFLPVRICLGKPRFWPEAANFPYVPELAPVGSLFKITDRDEFTEKYTARLEKIGVETIGTKLEDLAQSYVRPLVLLCYEKVLDGSNWCHRQVFADWWETQTGIVVPEAQGLDAAGLAATLELAQPGVV